MGAPPAATDGEDGEAHAVMKPLDVQFFDNDSQDGKARKPTSRRCQLARKVSAWVCVSLSGATAALYYILIRYMTHISIKNMLFISDRVVNRYCTSGLTSENITQNIRWPGCRGKPWDDNCTLPCYSKELPLQVAEFNLRHPGRLLSYSSRPHDGIDTAELRGWFLPARADRVPAGRLAPRVVMQHGFMENSNYWRYWLLSYMLRLCGIDVVANNFRDHCYSGRSASHPQGRPLYEWGNAYPYDLLGAWDFARNDPSGEMGGPMNDSQVGIFGFSKGGFTALNAMGIEARVPATWVDGSPFLPRNALEHTLKRELAKIGVPESAMSFLIEPTWRNTDRAALQYGVNFSRHTPESSLPLGPDTRRPLYVVHNRADYLCPIVENEQLMRLLRSMPEKYAVQEGGPWTPGASCHGNAHCNTHLSEFGEYLGRLCRFWRASFDMGTSECEAIVLEATRRLPPAHNIALGADAVLSF